MIEDQTHMEVEYHANDGLFVFNLIFPHTGEIRQKRVSSEWLQKRVFKYELKTWEKVRDELITHDDCSVRVYK